MTVNEYISFIGTAWQFEMEPLHPARKLVGEAGEFMELLNKIDFKNRSYPALTPVLELGDIMFYVVLLGITQGCIPGIEREIYRVQEPQVKIPNVSLYRLNETYILTHHSLRILALAMGFISNDNYLDYLVQITESVKKLALTFDTDIETVIEANILKLNSDDFNGWRQDG